MVQGIVHWIHMHVLDVFSKGGDAWMYLRTLFSDPWNSGPERNVVVNSLSMSVRKRTSDMYVIDEVFRRKVYGEPPKGIVLDLGANVGAFSLYAGQTATRVYAFEPDSSNFTQLVKNTERNNTLPISIFQKAVGGETGKATLHSAAINKGASSLILSRSSTDETVVVVTLDDALSLCGVSHVDFLKVDIEGSEYALFDAVSINTLQRISTIAMETHAVRGREPREIVAKLERAGFTVTTSYTRFSPFGMHMVYATRRA